MKKFLSILLALAVGFTFTFGSAMSAFAYTAGTGYTVDEQKALLAAAYNQAIAGAEAYKVNYDGETYGATADKDITTFTVSKEAVITGVDTVYANTVSGIKTDSNTLLGVTFEGDYDATTNNATSSVDVIKVKNAILAGAKTATNSDGVKVVEAAAWSDYKAELIKLVDTVDVSVYTETKNETKVTAKDGEQYDTAKEAANADIAYAKAIINNAKLATAKEPANAEASWKATTHKEVYDEVFGAAKVIKIKENKDDAIDTNLVTSLTYSLAGNYATTKSEEAEKANLGVIQAQAKAALLAAITNYENSSDYNKKQDEEIAAYKEAKTYLIENGKITDYTTTPVTVSFDLTYSIKKSDVTSNTYVTLTTAAAKANKYIADLKAEKTAAGFNWDDDLAAKALKTQLLAIYGGTANTPLVETGLYTSDLTAGTKAAAKIDYSEIEAAEYNSAMTGVTSYEGKAYVYNKKAYYENEWKTVKAAIDTFNAAVDAAKVQNDVNTANAALTKALDKITEAHTVYNNISTGAANTYDALKKYAGLAYTNAHAADANVTAIYVTFGEEADTIGTGKDLPAKSVYLWFIEKGARTAKDAAALYADACKVIDAYKTLATLKTEAAAVVSQINALPATPALTDKAAVVAAKDAYDALPADGKNYVTNVVTLNAALKTVETAEAYSVAGMVNALPTVAKLTVADKASVKAAKDAYKAYRDTTEYASFTYTTSYSFDTALDAIKNLEKDAIVDAYKALNNKYIADKLTAEDAAAVKALQDAIAAYIEEYAETPGVDIENKTAKIAAVVAALAPEFGDAEAKAYVQDLSIAVRTAKSGKKVKVTAKADVQTLVDNGYTVTYKFYKSTKKSSGYKNTVNKTTNTYTNTNPVKGKNYYKVKLVVKNADGAVVATTPLTQCKYGVRTIK